VYFGYPNFGSKHSLIKVEKLTYMYVVTGVVVVCLPMIELVHEMICSAVSFPNPGARATDSYRTLYTYLCPPIAAGAS
jgi:hypothetical protein